MLFFLSDVEATGFLLPVFRSEVLLTFLTGSVQKPIRTQSTFNGSGWEIV